MTRKYLALFEVLLIPPRSLTMDEFTEPVLNSLFNYSINSILLSVMLKPSVWQPNFTNPPKVRNQNPSHLTTDGHSGEVAPSRLYSTNLKQLQNRMYHVPQFWHAQSLKLSCNVTSIKEVLCQAALTGLSSRAVLITFTYSL